MSMTKWKRAGVKVIRFILVLAAIFQTSQLLALPPEPFPLSIIPQSSHAYGLNIAGDGHGNFVAVWNRRNDSKTIVRIFDGSGIAKTDEIIVNDDGLVADHNSYATIAMDTESRFVVAWKGGGLFYLRRYQYNRESGAVTALTPNTNVGGEGIFPDISMRAGGQFVVMSGREFGRFHADLRPIDPDWVLIDRNTNLIRIDQNQNGDFVITWTEGVIGTNSRIFYQRFDSNARSKDAGPIAIPNIQGSFNPDVVMNEDGSFFIVWNDFLARQRPYRVFGQKFDANGNAVFLEPFLISTTVGGLGAGSHLRIDNDANGNVLTTWWGRSCDHPENPSLENLDIMGRRFDINGFFKEAGDFTVHAAASPNNDLSMDVAITNNGQTAIVYKSHLNDGQPTMIFASLVCGLNGTVLAAECGRPVNCALPGGPDILVEPLFVDFGDVAVRRSSAPRTVTIRNAGQGNLEVREARLSQGSWVAATPAIPPLRTLAADATETLSLTCTPTQTGEQFGTLTIAHNVNRREPVAVNYRCNGIECRNVDNDRDGFGSCSETPDCNDNDAAVFPGHAEICDGKDNNCDGTTDEGLLNACGRCGAVPNETCNNIDDDCDGSIDENLSQRRPCGQGICAGGTQTLFCTNGRMDRAWSACSTTRRALPQEKCDNNLDDNCNGRVNEGCAPDIWAYVPLPPVAQNPYGSEMVFRVQTKGVYKKTFVIRNRGRTDLVVRRINVVNNNRNAVPNELTVARLSSGLPYRIRSGRQIMLEATLDLQYCGRGGGRFEIHSNDPDTPIKTIPVRWSCGR